MNTAKGGKAIYGASLGILMLETRFPRILGDLGNARTWPFPVLYHVVAGASPERVVVQQAQGLLETFLTAADQLVRQGAHGIITNCGFLALFQQELASHCHVPVAASSLMQVPFVERLLPPGQRVGILTISAQSLTARHLEAAGARTDTPVQGTESGDEFSRAILNDELTLDVAACERDIITAAATLLEHHPDVGAIVLECTNMPPYAAALREAIGVPVFDMYSFACWFHAGLSPRQFM